MQIIQETIHSPAHADSNARLTGYLNPNHERIDRNRLHPAVLILPGGAYNHTSYRENEPVALRLTSAGIQSFGLDYSVSPAVYPQALCETLLSIAYIRTHAKEYHIDPDNISICGFSAGGHLALTAAAYYREEAILQSLSCNESLVKPNRLILSYPVVTSGKYAHEGSFSSLLGENVTNAALRQKLSMELHVTDDFPPAYLWHTYTDNTVPVQNSLLLAEACAEAGVPLEMHLYPFGEHGLSLGDYVSNGNIAYGHNHICSSWIEEAIDFIYR